MSRPWMPLYVADYLADTAHLSAAESGAYLHLIMHYWQKGKLPTDDRALSRIAKMSAKEWADSRAVISEFFTRDWRHDRIEAELAASKEKYERRAAAGRKGGSVRASDEEAMPEQCLSNASARLNQLQPQSLSERHNQKNKIENLTSLESAPREDLGPFPTGRGMAQFGKWAPVIRRECPGRDVEAVADQFRAWAKSLPRPPDLTHDGIQTMFCNWAKRQAA